MVSCQTCGAANQDDAPECARCGAPLLNQPSLVGASAGTTSGDVLADVGLGLTLPDWLKRAAAETPESGPQSQSSATEFAYPRSAEPLPLPGLHFAANGPESLRSVPSIPTGDLESSIPAWLRPHSDDEGQGAPPVSRPDAAMADMASFISETDLPEWIRQIAVADAARKEEETRLAEDSAAASAALARSEAATSGPKRAPLPGEVGPSSNAGNPWLVRNDRSTADAAGSAWGAAEAKVAASGAVAALPTSSQPASAVAPASAETVERAAVKTRWSLPSLAAGSSPGTRKLLIAAVALLVLIVIVAVVL